MRAGKIIKGTETEIETEEIEIEAEKEIEIGTERSTEKERWIGIEKETGTKKGTGRQTEIRTDQKTSSGIEIGMKTEEGIALEKKRQTGRERDQGISDIKEALRGKRKQVKEKDHETTMREGEGTRQEAPEREGDQALTGDDLWQKTTQHINTYQSTAPDINYQI